MTTNTKNKTSDQLELDLVKLKQWRQNGFSDSRPFLLLLSDLLFRDKVTLMQPTWWGVAGKFIFFVKSNRVLYFYEGWWHEDIKEIEGNDRLVVLNVMQETIMRKYPQQAPSNLVVELGLQLNKLQEK